jgi:vitamin B12 transporter
MDVLARTSKQFRQFVFQVILASIPKVTMLACAPCASRSLLILCSFVLASAVAQAGEEAGNIDEVVVTAHRLEENLPTELAEYGNRLTTVSVEAYRNGGYVDIAQGLQAIGPGLYVQPKNGPFDYADISLLGSRTDDVLWLIDGVRINNRLYSGTPPNDTLPAGMVDHVEVLEGGQSLFYGTAALAGAINIVTRPFSDTPKGSINVGGDTNSGIHLDGFFSDGFGPQQVVVYGSFDKSQGYEAFRPQDYQPSATDRDRGYDVWTLGGKYAFNFSDQLRLSASYQHTKADLDFSIPYRVARDVNSRDEDLATAKLDYDFSDHASFYVKSYYHRWHTSYDTYYNDLQNPGTIDVLYQDAFWGYDDYGINALSKFGFTRGLEYYLGYDLQIYGGKDEVLVIEPMKEHTQAVFGQIRLTPDLIPNGHLAAGFRYNAPNEGEHATIWNLSGQYDFTDSFFFRTTMGTNFRLPTAEELFANDPQDERGNPNLLPEHSKSINASIGGRFSSGESKFSWELIGFARDITNLIDYATFDDETGQAVFGNVLGTVRVRGGEIALNADFTQSTSANLSFTTNTSKQDGGVQTDRVPEQLLKAGLDYHPSALPFGATFNVSYTGKTYVTVGGESLEYGKYAVVDLSGRYFLDHARRQKLSLSVQNLFDRQYGRPNRGCMDVPTDGPYDCSSPYIYINRGLPRTAVLRYSYDF